jgi:hypothetical protein
MKSVNRKRRVWCLLGLALALPIHAQSSKLSKTTKPLVEVWKSPYCECCQDWITHLQKNGFLVKVTETMDTATQCENWVCPPSLGLATRPEWQAMSLKDMSQRTRYIA